MRQRIGWVVGLVLGFVADPAVAQRLEYERPENSLGTRTFSVAGQSYRLEINPRSLFVPVHPNLPIEQLPVESQRLTSLALESQHQKTDEPAKDYLEVKSIPIVLDDFRGVLVPRCLSTAQYTIDAGGSLPRSSSGSAADLYFPRTRRDRKVFRSFEVIPIGSVTARFKQTPEPELLTQIERSLKLGAPRKADYLPDTYTFTSTADREDSRADVFVAQAQFQQLFSEHLRWVRPDFAFQAYP